MTTTLNQLNHTSIKDYQSIACDLATELKQTAQERDFQSGVPNYEIQRLRETGLLPLVVPQTYGGIGATWVEALPIVREIAKADSSTAQLYGYHLLLTVLGQVAGTPEQADRYYRETAEQHLFWGNAINVRDTRLHIEPEGNHYRVNGTKTFCTGTVVADRRVCGAMQQDSDIPVLFILPSDRVGITYNHDWDTIGQRRTASGSFTFTNVLVLPEEILPPPNPERECFLYHFWRAGTHHPHPYSPGCCRRSLGRGQRLHPYSNPTLAHVRSRSRHPRSLHPASLRRPMGTTSRRDRPHHSGNRTGTTGLGQRPCSDPSRTRRSGDRSSRSQNSIHSVGTCYHQPHV